MWSALHAGEKTWLQKLESDEVRGFSPSVTTATANCFCAVRQFGEVFLGGDDSPVLLQVIGLGEEMNASDIDVLASVLLPESNVEVVFTARGEKAKTLVASFWTWRPEAPALMQSKGAYHQLLCCFADLPETLGELSAAHIKRLQGDGRDETFRIYVKGEDYVESDEEQKRAGIIREHSMIARNAV